MEHWRGAYRQRPPAGRATLQKGAGERGVTLIGYSLGVRVIYSCLMNCVQRRAFSLAENAVLGTPCPSDARDWCAIRSVVAGRLFKVYS